MRHLAKLLFCTGVLWASFTASGMESAMAPLGVRDFAHSAAHLNVTRTSPEQTTIALVSPVIVTQDVTVDYQTYQQFGIAGEQSVLAEGSPAVPQVTRFYQIPHTGSADMIITGAEYDVVNDVNPLPLQLRDTGFNALVRNEAVYSKDGWYPENVAVMSDPMIMRDFRVVTVTLYPVQVNPVTHQARIYRNLSVDVVANNHPGVNELLNPHRPSREWASIYRGTIANLDANALDDMTTTPGSLLILTSSNATPRPWADSLAQWKTRMGYRVTVDARASWTSTQALTVIRAAYANAPIDAPLEFVVLMGDPGAAWGIPVDGSNTGNYDHSYALGNTGDDLEDIGVGRLSGGTATALATINAKIMGYERNPRVESSPGVADTMWFHKAFLYAGVGRSSPDNYLMMRWGRQQFIANTAVDSVTVLTHPSDAIVPTDVLTRLNAGVGFFFWQGTWIGGMPTSTPDNCNTVWRLPICVTMAESAGDYVYSAAPDGPAENFLCTGTPSNPRGGVCGIGTSTSGVSYNTNVYLTSGLLYTITDLQVEHLGTAMAGAKAQLYYSFPPDWPDPYGDPRGLVARHVRLFNLLGDPSLSMWTDVPQRLIVTHPDSLDIGASSVEITVRRSADSVAVENALVCLWKRSPDSTWVTGLTDAVGHITLPVSVNAAGSMALTITKHNIKPYLYTIPCIQAAAAPLFSSVVLDDDNTGGSSGNGDHLMNPGETIDLPVYVRNFGNETTVTNVSATLTSGNPLITVVSGASAFAGIAPGDSALAATPFRIHISPSLQDNVQVMLPLTITSSAGQTVGAIPMLSHAGNAQYQRHQLSGVFDPGATVNLTVVVRNVGSVPMTGVTGELEPLTPLVQTNTATASFGDIAMGALDSNSAVPFSITASPLAYRGLQAPMRLILTTSSGFVDTTEFTISLGTAQSTDPTGPDAFGYVALDNTDTTSAMHPVFSYVDISSSGQNLNLNDTGEKTTINPIWSAVRRLPFGFKFYGQVYDSITVCSNGWCAFGDQSWYDGFRNFQIPAMRAPDAMIAPYWDDLQTTGTGHGVWVKNDSTNHRYIIQWKATFNHGTFNLDFEVVLYDTTFQPTVSGNGNVVVQYNHVVMNMNSQYDDDAPGSTIGIQMPGNTVGLSYAYQDIYAAGAATVSDGRAILFTTDARMLFGQIEGTVVNMADNQPMAGVNVLMNGQTYHAITDAAGHYAIPDVLIGAYNMHTAYYRFDNDSVNSVRVALDSTTIVNFALRHPEMTLTPESLQDTLSDMPVADAFTISNPGNGLLDYSIQVSPAGNDHPAPWDSVGTVDLSGQVGNSEAWGCELFNNEWWVTDSNGPNGTPVLYRFDLDGQLLGSVPQPSTTALGWFDLATDGTLLYGADNQMIYGIDAGGTVRDSLPSPLNPSRALAYDSVGRNFWVADYTSDIYALGRQGTQVAHVPNPGLIITGLGWYSADPDTGQLYIFGRDGAGQRRVSKYNPLSGSFRTVRDLPDSAGELAAGCTVTADWNNLMLVFGGVVRNAHSARLAIHEMAFDTSWIHIAPVTGYVAAGRSRSIALTLYGTHLRNATYHVNLRVTSAIYDSTVALPITVEVRHAVSADPSPEALPARYALHQNYPNPFNPTTNIRYELKTDGLTRLSVFNVLGEKVADLVNAKQSAGFYDISFDASALPSGVYFYRLTSGNFTQSAKMILMK
ncbi:MAG TPA: C25 family cysteine peptidase [bacterium]|jgi:hypothetical protein